jgi:hypothetical protein
MYADTNTDVVQKFADATANESNRRGSLSTHRRDSGEVELRSYGWAAIARVDSATGEVVVFDGHADLSPTTREHIRKVLQVVDDERLVRSSATPVVARPPECVKYIDNYTGGFTTPNSPQDLQAMQDVAESL